MSFSGKSFTELNLNLLSSGFALNLRGKPFSNKCQLCGMTQPQQQNIDCFQLAGFFFLRRGAGQSEASLMEKESPHPGNRFSLPFPVGRFSHRRTVITARAFNCDSSFLKHEAVTAFSVSLKEKIFHGIFRQRKTLDYLTV